MRNELDELLKHSLTPINEPDPWLNQRIINQVKEREKMKKRIWKKLPAAALLTVIVLGCVSASVFALHRLSIRDIMEKHGDKKLLDAFMSEDAVFINETQSYGGYNVTLLGIVSGKNLSDFYTSNDYISHYKELLSENRTYIVVAIERTDGAPMAEVSSSEFNKELFCVSPLIRDFNPAFYNIYSFNGGGARYVEDGVRYHIEECDNVEAFADHGLYVCVCDDVFYVQEAYQFDEATGIISRNEEYDGLNALFDLPIDASKADPEAAKKFLKETGYGEREGELDLDEMYKSELDLDEMHQSDLNEKNFEDKDKWRHQITPENIDLYADCLEDSIQILTPDEEGFIHYEYRSLRSDYLVSSLLEQEEKFIIKGFAVGSSEENKTDEAYIDTLQINDDGTVTYACYRVKQSVLDNSSE